jgi:hypothetical protein
MQRKITTGFTRQNSHGGQRTDSRIGARREARGPTRGSKADDGLVTESILAELATGFVASHACPFKDV